MTRPMPLTASIMGGVTASITGWAMAFLLITLCAAQAQTARERGLLDFIGGIESSGYDDYYRGVAAPPPRPLTGMRVGEVLDWQDSIDAASRSEAAGRYQIMEDTLRGLVRQGVVSPEARFDAATQDRLALALLKRRGWDPARTDLVAMGDAIAHEWAALPVCSGLRTGRSAYDGIAGNRSRTSCEAWLRVLGGSGDPALVAAALARARSIAASRATLPPSALDRFIRDMVETGAGLSARLGAVATALLFSLLLIDWVWTTARQVSRGAGTATLLGGLFQRAVLAALFLFLITTATYSDLIIRSAEGLLGFADTGATINLLDLFDRILMLVFEISGRSWYNIADKLAAAVILIVGMMILGLILIAYLEVYIAFAAALVALGFAGWSQTRPIAVRYLKDAVAATFGLFTALTCGALISELVRLDGDNALLVTANMIVLALVILKVPAAMEKTLTGRSRPSAGARLARLIGGGSVGLAKEATGMILTRGRRARKGRS